MPAAKRKLTLDEELEKRELAASVKREYQMAFFKPYPKQRQFIEWTASKRETMLMASNQYGKTKVGGYSVACHMTGLYPKDWKGKKWNRPTRGWIAGETSLVVRDVQQKQLCGEPGVDAQFGTGMIPKDCFADKPSLARGITDAYDTIQVYHHDRFGKRDGVSVARFKSYEQGRAKFQGETLDWGWADEEPPEDVYAEFLTRLAEGGILFMTFTPLKGRSKVVLRFLDEPSPDRQVVNATLDEAEHFSPEEKARRLAGYLEHERDARARGIPILGSGAVYGFSEDTIKENGISLQQVPPQWHKLWGIDFGIGHRFGALLIAWDKDVDCIHGLHTVRMADGSALHHATAMKSVAAAVPVAWPHDGHQRDKGSGEELALTYRGHGLSMLANHATFETGGYSREAAVMEIADRATTGRLKVASHLWDFFEEFRLYHRKDGMIVKAEDDLMSALEKAIMMKRFARQVSLGSKVARRPQQRIALGVDANAWGA